MSEQVKIMTPEQLSPKLTKQLIEFIAKGSQVSPEYIESGIPKAQLIGILFHDNNIISTAVLKNPRGSYIKDVFKKAGEEHRTNQYKYELGYIVTDTAWEGKKRSQALLNELFPRIKSVPFFATSRKASMIHILKKFRLELIGKVYDEDLNLLVYNPFS